MSSFVFLGVAPPKLNTEGGAKLNLINSVQRERHFRQSLRETIRELEEDRKGRMCCEANGECFTHGLIRKLRVSVGEK